MLKHHCAGWLTIWMMVDFVQISCNHSSVGSDYLLEQPVLPTQTFVQHFKTKLHYFFRFDTEIKGESNF